MVERSSSAGLDSCGERGGDVAGEGAGARTAGSSARFANPADDGDTDGSEGGGTIVGRKNPIGLCADRFLLLDVESFSQDSAFRTDFGGKRNMAKYVVAGTEDGGGGFSGEFKVVAEESQAVSSGEDLYPSSASVV